MKFFALVPFLFVDVIAYAQTPAFTYQGRLQTNGAPADGLYDLRFTLHDTAALANQIGGALTNAPTGVSNGLFTVALDFGAGVFDGNARWLQIGIRSFGDTNQYVTLSPRQLLTATPYAIRALNAANAATASNLSGTLPATSLTGTLPDARLSTNVALLNGNATFLGSVTATQFNGSGVGLFNVPATGLTGTLPDARLSPNVALLSGAANFAGNVSAPFLSGNGTGLTNVPGRIFEVIPTSANIQALANTGYLATNDTTAVVVTLPASMRVGETVRVAGSGAGGWIVAQNAGQSIIVANLLDSVGLNWKTNDSTRPWKAVAASADGKKLVAVVNSGQIYTSTDYGTTWSPHDANRAWWSVASAADGSKLVAVVNVGQIYTSTDSGGSWTPRDFNRGWTSVASSADGVNLVATVNGGQIYTSGNSGGSWTPRDITRNWISVASSADGARLAAAVSFGQLYVSSDAGATWAVTGPGTSIQWTCITSSADGARLAAVFDSGGIYMSTDSGATWTQRGGLPALSWTSTAFSGDGSTIATVGSSTKIYVSSQATTTVGTAGYLSGARLAAVELEYLGNGLFMPITFVGAVRPH